VNRWTVAVLRGVDVRAWGIFLAIVGGALWSTVPLVPVLGAPLAIMAATTMAVLALAICEWCWPHEPAWLQSHGDLLTDVWHALLSDRTCKHLVQAATQAGAVLAAGLLAAPFGGGLWPVEWPVEWPLLAQLGLALLVAELVQYWLHRIEHRWDGLWRFHATHHSAPRLYWLNAARLHPVDTALLYLTSFGVLVVLGCPEDVIVLFAVFDAVFGMVQHSNVRLPLGPLSYVLSTPELHRWHHSRRLEEANANYGSNLIVWDLVFGTFLLPHDRRPPIDPGVANMSAFPQDYWGQILSPFRWKSLTQNPGADRTRVEAPWQTSP
jgi:sterol desaturase/sphingolipid hydroxylase (fatty acid hydroxylase superfamily)